MTAPTYAVRCGSQAARTLTLERARELALELLRQGGANVAEVRQGGALVGLWHWNTLTLTPDWRA